MSLSNGEACLNRNAERPLLTELSGRSTVRLAMAPADRKYIAALAGYEKYDSARFRAALARFGSAERMLRAPRKELMRAGLRSEDSADFMRARADMDPDAAQAVLERSGVKVVLYTDDDYPELLRQIHDAPAALFIRGDRSVLTRDCLYIGMVGTRSMSAYGASVVSKLVPPLARAGAAIISGLALGIDAEAHSAALRHGAPTIAVLGSGADKGSVYPRLNAALAERIVREGGLLVSEWPPGTRSAKYRFPLRNRIIAGLCHGVAAVEAPERSGALITANLALECSRDVFAVPGPITHPNSAGTNRLIAQGAIPVCKGADIPEYYGISTSGAERRKLDFTGQEKVVLEAIAGGADSIEKMLDATDMDASEILSSLTSLELKRVVAVHNELYIIIDNAGP